MPTENKPAEPFQREERYIVIKRKDLAAVPVAYRRSLVEPMFSLQSHLPLRKCLVIESDWPEYEPAWQMIERRLAGANSEQPEVVAVINEEGEHFKETVVEHRPGIDLLPVGTELVDRAHVIRVQAERDALQLRLNAADQRIDELTPRYIEHPEGKRERFEKWVMATKHPVFGFLDGRSLARSDDRTGYADEYIQGLWVAYLEFGAEQPKPVSVVPELTPELRWILGQMCFQHIHTAQALRLMGHEIARKAEDEQAVTIYWMLGHYLKDPANWRENATVEMKAVAPTE